MRTIGNVLWLVLTGVWLAVGYVVAGLLASVLIVTIPFGVAPFRLASFVIRPFGRRTTWRGRRARRGQWAEAPGLDVCALVRGILDAHCRWVLLH